MRLSKKFPIYKQKELTHQLPSLPPVEAFWSELPALFGWIEEGRPRQIPAAFPLTAGDIVIRPPAGTLSVPGMATSAPLEIIRFAASNRLCVELDYMDQQGRRSLRIIEPYSLRRTQAGELCSTQSAPIASLTAAIVSTAFEVPEPRNGHSHRATRLN